MTNEVKTTEPADLSLPITEEWLKASGFRWGRLDRQPTQHWMIWLGDAVREGEGDGNSFTSYEDLGIEVAAGFDDKWFCWLRSDCAGLYHRFIHTRHMRTRIELVRLIEALTGQPWTPEWHIGGNVRGPKGAAQMLKLVERVDVQMMVTNYPWHDIERDPYRAGASAATLRELVDYQMGKKP